MIKYIIWDQAINASKVANCLETSVATLRTNNAGTKYVLKYTGAQPSWAAGYTEYDLAGIKVVLEDSEWISEGI